MINRIAFCAFTLAYCWLPIQIGSAQTSYPMLMVIDPVAAQVGQTSLHTVKSRYSLFGAYEIKIAGNGVRGEIVHPEIKPEDRDKPPSLESMKVRIHVAADAVPGVRDFRIATPSGVSTVGQLVVARNTVIDETSFDQPADQAGKIKWPATLCGRIEKAEDVDRFVFDVEAGQSLAFHVLCMRLQDRIHDLQQHADPILAIRNSMGSTIAVADNSFRGDPYVYHTFAQAGQYELDIRDVRYQGNNYWGYAIEVSDRPFVTSIYPLGLEIGTTSPVQLVGDGLPDGASSSVTLPKGLASAPIAWPVPVGDGDTKSMMIVPNEFAVEIENLSVNDAINRAQKVAFPGGINGRIDADTDVDYFSFDARKGQVLSIEVFASRVNSPLDSHLRILDERGDQLQISDDLRIGKRNHADSAIDSWTVPSDGKYFIEIRDLHLRGGRNFSYFVKLSESGPSFTLFADTDKTLLTPGTCGVVFVRAERKNGASGEIQLSVEGLPDGVTASCGRILAGTAQDGCIVFEAARDRTPVLADLRISGSMQLKADSPSAATLESQAIVYQETYQPGGGRGHWPVDNHALSVGLPSDIRQVRLSTHEVSLTPGSTRRIDIEIDRAPGFDKNISLEVSFTHLNSVYGNSLPEGVTVDATNSNTLLTGGATKGHIVLKSAANSPAVEKQQIVVMANVSINFVMKATYCSRPVLVSVVP